MMCSVVVVTVGSSETVGLSAEPSWFGHEDFGDLQCESSSVSRPVLSFPGCKRLAESRAMMRDVMELVDWGALVELMATCGSKAEKAEVLFSLMSVSAVHGPGTVAVVEAEDFEEIRFSVQEIGLPVDEVGVVDEMNVVETTDSL